MRPVPTAARDDERRVTALGAKTARRARRSSPASLGANATAEKHQGFETHGLDHSLLRRPRASASNAASIPSVARRLFGLLLASGVAAVVLRAILFRGVDGEQARVADPLMTPSAGPLPEPMSSTQPLQGAFRPRRATYHHVCPAQTVVAEVRMRLALPLTEVDDQVFSELAAGWLDRPSCCCFRFSDRQLLQRRGPELRRELECLDEQVPADPTRGRTDAAGELDLPAALGDQDRWGVRDDDPCSDDGEITANPSSTMARMSTPFVRSAIASSARSSAVCTTALSPTAASRLLRRSSAGSAFPDRTAIGADESPPHAAVTCAITSAPTKAVGCVPLRTDDEVSAIPTMVSWCPARCFAEACRYGELLADSEVRGGGGRPIDDHLVDAGRPRPSSRPNQRSRSSAGIACNARSAGILQPCRWRTRWPCSRHARRPGLPGPGSGCDVTRSTGVRGGRDDQVGAPVRRGHAVGERGPVGGVEHQGGGDEADAEHDRQRDGDERPGRVRTSARAG